MAELETTVETTESTGTETVETEKTETSESAELAKLRAELAKQKAATDKATKEAAETKRALRAKQSAEEVAAEESKAQQEALMQELETLRKEKAVAATTAKVLPLIGDGEVAAQVAEYLYGAEDVDAALTALQKAWTAKEKALRLEFGKIPAPGAGGTDGPVISQEQFNAMKYTERVKFKIEHPEAYEKLMGR